MLELAQGLFQTVLQRPFCRCRPFQAVVQDGFCSAKALQAHQRGIADERQHRIGAAIFRALRHFIVPDSIDKEKRSP